MVALIDPLDYEVSIPCKDTTRVIQRKRSQFYRLAKAELWSVLDLGAESMDLRLVVTHFQHWLDRYHDTHVYLSNGEKDLFLKSINRFTADYRQSLKRRMHRMRDIDWSVKIELTLDPKKFMGLYDQFIFLPRLWNVINTWLKRTFGKFEFLRIMEITKKGRPHLHILLAFYDPKWQKYFKAMSRRDKQRRFQAFYGELRAVSTRNNGGHIWVKPIQGKIRLVNYVMKYVNKSISVRNVSEANYQDRVYGALLFATNRRLFSVSRGLRIFAKPKKASQGFKYMGCIPSHALFSFCRAKDIPYGFSVSFDSDMADPYEYPLLFDWKGGG